jgi:chaperonin GroEL
MGEIKVGDEICGTNNSVQKVIGVFPKGIRKVFKVTTSDGRSAECCEDHLWKVVTHYGKEKTVTTKELFQSGLHNHNKKNERRFKFFIPVTSVEFNSKAKLAIDPYLLGVLIGDGSLSYNKNSEIEIAVGLKEEYILDNLILPTGCKIKKQFYDKKNYIRGTISNTERGKNIAKKLLEEVNLLGTFSDTKFIPKEYLHSSLENRQKLLNGLIDTDGHINKRGLFEYSTVSKQLCEDFAELCRSLGKQITIRKHERKPNSAFGSKPIYRVIELKGYKYGLKIAKIEKLNKSTEMRCIKVSNSDSLYITDDHIVTHNTTTATVLAYNLFFNGYKMAATGRSTIALKKGIDWACSRVVSFIKENTIQVRNDDDIISVGTISANGDREIGTLLCEAIKKVGEDGIVTVEKAKSVHTTLSVIEGLSLDTGFVSPYFVTDQEKLTSELTNPYVLVTNRKLTSKEHVIAALSIANENDRPILIIGEEIDQEALHVLLANKMQGTVISCAVKAPSYGENRTDLLQDVCLVTGATCFDMTQALSLEKLKEEHLGSCERVIVSKGQTTIIGLGSNVAKSQITNRVEELRNVLTDETIVVDELKRSNTKKRLAKLSGGIAVVNVGGATEVEILEKKDRVDDALNATQAAVQEGILPGGGVALFRAAEFLEALIKKNPNDLNEDELFGARVVAETCRSPLKVIVENAGKNFEVIATELSKPKNKNFRFGYDAHKHKFCDMIEAGIIDPCKVERLATEYACSVVGLILTCNCVIQTQEEGTE